MVSWPNVVDDLRLVAETAPIEALPDLLAELERAKATVYARLLTNNSGRSRSDSIPKTAEDHLLTAEQVAEKLQVARKWVYRHAAALGAVRLSRKKLRFPSSALERYLARRKAASTRR